MYSPFELPESRSSHLWSVTCLSSHLTCSTFPLPGLIQRKALYTLLHSPLTISVGGIPANAQTVSLALTHLNAVFHWTNTLLFFGTPRHYWRQPRLRLHIGESTWQHSGTAYTYPRSVPLGSKRADLCSQQNH